LWFLFCSAAEWKCCWWRTVSRLIKMPDFCKVAWNFLLLAI
jgi:hypothetical protein